MTFRDWDEVYRFLALLTKWPPVVVYLAFLFRGSIARKLSGLEKVKVKEVEIIFRALKELKTVAQESSPVLAQQVLIKVPILSVSEKVEDKEEDNEDEVAVVTEKEDVEQVTDILDEGDQEETK